MSERTPSPRSPAAEPRLVLVTGIAGQQGGHVARRLLARGHRVRGLSRTPDGPRLAELRSLGAEIVAGSFEEPSTVARAAEGVDAMFLMGTPFPGGPASETRLGIAAIDAAASAHVPWLVYSSVSDADRRTGIPHFESKFAVEEHLRRSGVAFAVSAPTAFMENFLAPYQLPSLRRGILAAAVSPDRPVPMVALDDLAGFVTHLLEHPGAYRGQRFNVASDIVTQAGAARLLAKQIGRPIEFQRIPLATLEAQNPDTAKMFDWFERVGYSADPDALRRTFPDVGWQRFDAWVARQDWARLLA